LTNTVSGAEQTLLHGAGAGGAAAGGGAAGGVQLRQAPGFASRDDHPAAVELDDGREEAVHLARADHLLDSGHQVFLDTIHGGGHRRPPHRGGV
jgi:hypothetical protein